MVFRALVRKFHAPGEGGVDACETFVERVGFSAEFVGDLADAQPDAVTQLDEPAGLGREPTDTGVQRLVGFLDRQAVDLPPVRLHEVEQLAVHQNRPAGLLLDGLEGFEPRGNAQPVRQRLGVFDLLPLLQRQRQHVL